MSSPASPLPLPIDTVTFAVAVAVAIGVFALSTRTKFWRWMNFRVWTPVTSVASVAWRRYVLQKGPKLPSWTFSFECLMHMIQKINGPKQVDWQKFLNKLPKIRANSNTSWERMSKELSILPVKINDGYLRAEILFKPTQLTKRTIMYLHGGGYCLCGLKSHRGMMARIATAADANVLAVDYRLAPEHPFPAALEDALAAYTWLLNNPVCGQKIEARDIAFMGDSAGGGLSIATALAIRDRWGCSSLPLPSLVVAISPWVDLECKYKSWKSNREFDYLHKDDTLTFSKWYAGQESLTHPLISPVHANFSGYPPLAIHVGSHETLLHDAVALRDKADACKVRVMLNLWDDMPHVFQIFPNAPFAKASIAMIGEQVKEFCANES